MSVVRRGLVRVEDLLDGEAENAGDGEGQREAGIVPSGLDGVDGLPGDLAPVGQIGLAPPACGAQFAEPVLHGRSLQRWNRVRRSAIVSQTPTPPMTITWANWRSA